MKRGYFRSSEIKVLKFHRNKKQEIEDFKRY